MGFGLPLGLRLELIKHLLPCAAFARGMTHSKTGVADVVWFVRKQKIILPGHFLV